MTKGRMTTTSFALLLFIGRKCRLRHSRDLHTLLFEVLNSGTDIVNGNRIIGQRGNAGYVLLTSYAVSSHRVCAFFPPSAGRHTKRSIV